MPGKVAEAVLEAGVTPCLGWACCQDWRLCQVWLCPGGSRGGQGGVLGRDKSAPHLLQPHAGLTTPQRNMKVAVLSMALLFTILLCTPADAQVSPQCPMEGLKAGNRSWLQDITPLQDKIIVVSMKPLELASPFPEQGEGEKPQAMQLSAFHSSVCSQASPQYSS